MAIKITVKDYSKRPGIRPEDRPGFDPDRQVCRMVKRHREQIGDSLEAAYEQIPELPRDYLIPGKRIALGMAVRIALGLPAIALQAAGWISGWTEGLILAAAALWAVGHACEVMR